MSNKNFIKHNSASFRLENRLQSSASLNWTAEVSQMYLKSQMHVYAVLTRSIQGFWLSLVSCTKGKKPLLLTAEPEIRSLYSPSPQREDGEVAYRSLFHSGPP